MTIAEFINTVGFKVKDGDVKKVNDTFSSIKSTATKVLGAIGIGFSLANINSLVEEFDDINDKINYTIGGLGDVKDAQQGILEAANAAKTSYSDMASVVTNLVKSSPEMFPVEQALSFSTNLTKLMKTAGRNDAEIASIMEGMNKSFQKGAVDAETLSKMLEQAPETANYLAQKLGVAKTQLLQLAAEGKISVTDLKDAFVESSDEIEAAFGQLNFGVSDALLNIRNKWGFWLKETDEMLGLTQTIGKVMVRGFDMAMGVLNRVRNGVVWLTDKLGGANKALRLIMITAGAMLAVFHFDKIQSGLTAISKLIGNVNKKTLALVAGIVLLALLVEDFINFMQGNNSLLGAMLEKAGVDVEKFRGDLIGIWENIKTALTAVWHGIQNAAVPIFQGIWESIKNVFHLIGGIIEKIAPQFSEFIDALANGEVDTEKWTALGETIVNVGAAIIGAVLAAKTAFSVAKAVVGAVKGVSAVFSFLISPVGAVIAIIAALIAIGILLWKNWDQVNAFAVSIWTAIADFFSGIWEKITSTVTGALDAVWGVISGVWSTIWGFLSGIAANIWKTLTIAFTNILTGITTTVGNIKNSIVSGFQAAIDWIKSLPAQALRWGADIIQGIVDGITGAVGKVGEAVSGVANKIKSFLGFSEPEDGPLSDFHTYMPDMIDLMAKGIQKGRAVVRAAARDLAGDMAGEVTSVGTGVGKPSPSGGESQGGGWVRSLLGTVSSGLNALTGAAKPMPNTVSTVTGSNNVSRSIVQNVEINNKFEGDKAGQQKSATAMDKAADDVTSVLARGLAYAR